MYYEIIGYNTLKQASHTYKDVVYSKEAKNALIKQYKEYLKNKELDMIMVISYRNDGKLKEVITYQ